MGTWLTERRLTQVGARLRSLREELAMIDEQLVQFTDDADELSIRALVSETPQASHESNEARKHLDAMRKHRAHVAGEIAAAGIGAYEISPAEMQRIRDKTRVVYDQHGKAIGDEAMTLVFTELKRIRGN